MRLRSWVRGLIVAAFVAGTTVAHAQLSLTAAVDLALRADPRVRSAEAAVAQAEAGVAQAKAAFIPSVSVTGGIGKTLGVPLGLPVVFSVGSQSLVLNYSQPDYVRSARASLTAANDLLDQARADVASDVSLTYIELDADLQRRKALGETRAVIARLTTIENDRFAAGVEPRIELTRTRRSDAQVRLQDLQNESDVATLSAHLERLMGIATGARFETMHDSIPAFTKPLEMTTALEDTPALRAANANARSRDYIAHGDHRYNYLPQVAFGANYSRIATVGTDYTAYYPGFDPARHPDISYNSLEVGVQFTVPILDWAHRAKARQSAADAAKAHFDAAVTKMTLLDARDKLTASTALLDARVELASLDRELAQDQLDALRVQLQAGAPTQAGQPPLSPKDEQQAMLQERERYLDFLAADLELRRVQLQLMTQSGSLAGWVRSAVVAKP